MPSNLKEIILGNQSSDKIKRCVESMNVDLLNIEDHESKTPLDHLLFSTRSDLVSIATWMMERGAVFNYHHPYKFLSKIEMKIPKSRCNTDCENLVLDYL